MSQREANVFKFRDAVAEICGQYPELLEKQHALRVESNALETRTTCKRGLKVRARCSVKPEAADFNATIRKFRTVPREGAWNLESLVVRRKTLFIVQPISKNKKRAA